MNKIAKQLVKISAELDDLLQDIDSNCLQNEYKQNIDDYESLDKAVLDNPEEKDTKLNQIANIIDQKINFLQNRYGRNYKFQQIIDDAEIEITVQSKIEDINLKYVIGINDNQGYFESSYNIEEENFTELDDVAMYTEDDDLMDMIENVQNLVQKIVEYVNEINY